MKKNDCLFFGVSKVCQIFVRIFFGGRRSPGRELDQSQGLYPHRPRIQQAHIHTSICVVQTTIPSFDQQATVLALDHAVSIFARLLLRN
jgi:hypothetical protein